MCFKIDWASPIVGSKFTVFALFYFIFEGNFPNPRWAFIWRGDLTQGFLRYRFGSLFNFLSKDELTKKRDRILIKDRISNKRKYRTKKATLILQ